MAPAGTGNHPTAIFTCRYYSCKSLVEKPNPPSPVPVQRVASHTNSSAAMATNVAGRLPLAVHRIPDDRARHAMTAATAASQLRTDNGNHLDTFLAQQGVGVSVAIIGKHDAGGCTDKIGAAIPLS